MSSRRNRRAVDDQDAKCSDEALSREHKGPIVIEGLYPDIEVSEMRTSSSRDKKSRMCGRAPWAVAVAAVVAGFVGATAQAQTTIVPTAGQTPEQMAADRTACDTQAASQSGYHPSQPAPTASPSEPAAGQRLKGAARGAAAGAVREERTDKDEREHEDAVGAGAKAGAVVGGSRQRQDRRESRRETAQEEQAYSQKQAAYQQAFGACMAARGYTVQ